MQLRDYQHEMVDTVFDYICNKAGNPVVSAPGGVGKSLAMNAIMRRAVEEYPGTRVMSLVHDAKIIEQNYKSMKAFWPKASVGIYSSGLKRRDTQHPIIYAGIQSVAKRAHEFGKIHIVVIDEADMVSPKETTLYQKFIDALKAVNPKLKVIGFTATAYRMGVGCLTELELWDEVVLDLTKGDRFNQFVDEGFLKPLITKKACVEADVTNIAMKGNDFDEKSMQEAVDTDELNEAVISECIRYGSDRNHWLVFASGVKHGHKLAKLFNSKGVPAIMLSGEDSMEDREHGEADFRDGKYRVLVNVGLYSRGWDMVDLDLIAIVRATQSTQWWVQALLRGTRKSKIATNCLVLDFCGNTRRLGPVNMPLIPLPRRKGQEVKGECPVKECPQCHSYIHTRIMVCGDCGYIFPPPKTIEKKASTVEIMHRVAPVEPVVDEFKVLGVRYKPTVSKAGIAYLSVGYSIGTYTFNEAIFFQSGGARHLKLWWEHRGGQLPLPTSPQEAADRSGELRTPSMIRVDVTPQNKYPKVLGCEFDETPDDVEEIDIPF